VRLPTFQKSQSLCRLEARTPVALGRSLFRKGANFTAAMAFEMASTNLVLELSIIMVAFLGWQLTLAEFVGAPSSSGVRLLPVVRVTDDANLLRRAP
jgi:hypothetical protein